MKIIGQHAVNTHIQKIFCIVRLISRAEIDADTMLVTAIDHRLVIRMPAYYLHLVKAVLAQASDQLVLRVDFIA